MAYDIVIKHISIDILKNFYTKFSVARKKSNTLILRIKELVHFFQVKTYTAHGKSIQHSGELLQTPVCMIFRGHRPTPLPRPTCQRGNEGNETNLWQKFIPTTFLFLAKRARTELTEVT